MQEKLVKIDDQTAEIVTTKTVVEKQTVNIQTLIYERDSMVRTKNQIMIDYETQLRSLDAKVSQMNDEIKKLTDIGLRPAVQGADIPVVVIEEEKKVEPIQEEVVEEVKLEEFPDKAPMDIPQEEVPVKAGE